ncbi:hypothetical protein [Flavobacterium sp.]|uniref:hypothetical protein n=1 Tax=Flavobacterium sp. TaxID=239 RepID=UPI0026252600|nr:hypothetical protein [Flavobacterium sp.]
MNLAQNLTQHIANPQNIIIIDGASVNAAWAATNTAYLASNILPSPTAPTYYVVDLSLISNQFSTLSLWLTNHVDKISYVDSYSFILLGHELDNTDYKTQINTAIGQNEFYSIDGKSLTKMVSDFGQTYYPNYLQIITETTGVPVRLNLITAYSDENLCFSIPFFQALFYAMDGAMKNLEEVKFYFTKVTNASDKSTVAFKVVYENLEAYYDYSGGAKYNTLNASKTTAACVK